ncbi:toll-like receptor 4 [Ostrea edulis]|uniref:toll-like receptor 4 n=1 Tax=Ostrea edulis TaxID=37623 RepID=UPI00209605E3|nr:toll-like receptor 4 [Ostrea edulis]
MRYYFYWLVCLGFLHVTNASGSESGLSCCSQSKCRCSISSFGITADCSNLGLFESPDFNHSVTVIDLSFNFLHTFPEAGKLPRSLKYINMTKNKFTTFSNNSFRELPELVYLNLSHNDFSLNDRTFPSGVFSKLSNLRLLDLQRFSSTKDMNDKYPTAALSTLKNLTALYINGLPNSVLGRGIENLRQLSTLVISGNSGWCRITLITENTFRHVPFLEKLDISNCGVEHIALGSFSFLKKLKELSLSHNRQATFKILKNVSIDLLQTPVQILRLETLYCTYGMGIKLRVEDIRYFRNTSIRELYIGENRLEQIEPGFSHYLPKHLRLLSAPYNRFTFGLYLIEMCSLDSLEEIDISHRLEEPTANKHDFMCFNFDGMSCTENKRQVKIKTWARSSFWSNPYADPYNITLCVPKYLRVLHINHASLGPTLINITIPNNSLTSVYLQNNFFREFNGYLFGFNKIKLLDLSNNFCGRVSPTFFEYVPSLETLILNNNYLGETLSKDNNYVFRYLKNLRQLELKQNRINNLATTVFYNLINLQSLDLSMNVITEWKLDMGRLPSLKCLDLSNNQISFLSPSSTKQIDKLTGKRAISINLANNPLLCNCETKYFINWVHQRWVSKSITFINVENYTCLIHKSNEIQIQKFKNTKHLKDIVTHLEHECISSVAIIVVATCALILSAIILCCGLVYRYRWRLRYLYYMTKSRFHGYRALRHDHFKYDAFISYADEDRSFVVSKFIPELEEQSGLRLCLHNRDFLPGYDIAENILTAVQQSKKTIAILSGNYITSYWCMYELNMARMEGIYSREGEDVLFLVIYDHMSSEDIPLTLMDLMAKKSYIEFPNDEYGDVVFWNKVRETIGHH